MNPTTPANTAAFATPAEGGLSPKRQAPPGSIEELAERMNAKKISICRLAREAGMDSGNVNRILSQKAPYHNPKEGTRARLFAALAKIEKEGIQ